MRFRKFQAILLILGLAGLARADTSYVPIPATGIGGPAFGQEIDKRFTGQVPTTPSVALCSSNATSWTIPNTCASATATLTSNMSIDAVPPVDTTSGDFLTLQILQNAAGYWSMNWGPHVGFYHMDGSSRSIVVMTFPNSAEQLSFQWSPSLDKWMLNSRGAVTQMGMQTQGN